jgi:hypothetical protein
MLVTLRRPDVVRQRGCVSLWMTGAQQREDFSSACGEKSSR